MDMPNITYTPDYITEAGCGEIFPELESYPFEQITLTVHGQQYTPLRRICAFADPDISYSYFGLTPKTHPWTWLLLSLKTELQKELKCEYNYMLANYYESGKAKIGHHKDSEILLDTSVPIVTLSFGATRTMSFSRRGRKPYHQTLVEGSRLLLHDQQWTHAILADATVKKPRISLTFRKIHTIADLPMCHNQGMNTDLVILERTRPVKRTQCSKTTTSKKKKKCFKTDISSGESIGKSLASKDITSTHPYDPDNILKKAIEDWESEYIITPKSCEDTILGNATDCWNVSLPKPPEKITELKEEDQKNTSYGKTSHGISETQNPLNECNMICDSTPLITQEEFNAWGTELNERFSECYLNPENSPSEKLLNTQEVNRSKSLSENENLAVYWLNSKFAITVQRYNQHIFVHVREYFQDVITLQYYPTKWGICMNLETYYDFSIKIFNVSESLCYSTDSFVINNCILAVVENKKLRLQSFTQSTIQSECIVLDVEQVKAIRENILTINNFIVDYMFCKQLYTLVAFDIPNSSDFMNESYRNLKTIIENDLSEKIQTLYICKGCQTSAIDLTHHSCKATTNHEKYASLSSYIIMLCNIKNIANQYLKDHGKISCTTKQFKYLTDHLFECAS